MYDNSQKIESELINLFKSVPNAIDIDSDYTGTEKHADFIFHDVPCVLEIKSIKSTGHNHLDSIMQTVMDRPDVPFIYGGSSVRDFIKNCDDKDKITRDIYRKLTARINDSLKSANLQIKQTKTIYELHDYYGVVLFINEVDETLPPNYISRRLAESFNSKKEDSSHNFSDISAAIIYTAKHTTTIDSSVCAPLIFLQNDFSASEMTYEKICNYFSPLMKKHVTCIGMSYAESAIKDCSIFNTFINNANKEDKERPYDFIRRQYRKNRKYEHLEDEDLISLGIRLVTAMAPNFILGHGMAKLSEFSMCQYQFEFTLFLEETSLRKLDLRVFQARVYETPIMKKLLKQ